MGHFHVVFTLPAELRGVALCNQRQLYGLLFDAARLSLTTLAKQRLGGQLGVTAVLHTWDRELHLHPHLHCVVTAGAWDAAASTWKPSRARYLFPVAQLAALYRGVFLRRFTAMAERGDLCFAGRASKYADPAVFRRLLRLLHRKRWVVYAKRPFAGPEQVFRYLGRYTHRVAISDSRLVDVTPARVRIRTRGDGIAAMTPTQFVSRFLLHVLPAGFHKIRHFGLYAPAAASKAWLQARWHLERADTGKPAPAGTGKATSDEDNVDVMFVVANPQVTCSRCGGPAIRVAIPRQRGPPNRGATWS